jgi:hypothetical protein
VSEAIFFSRRPKQVPEKFSEIAKIGYGIVEGASRARHL